MHFFFSDAHLGLGSKEGSRERERYVVKFLEHVGEVGAESLWIVGDLFDYWFEYRTVIPKAFVRTLGAIAELTDAGVTVEYVIGNHDFGHKNFFTDELGVQLHGDDVERVLAGHRVLISHGDGKALNDTGYLILKKILRSRVTNTLWRILHPDIGIGIAAGASRKSRDHTTKKHYGGDVPGESDGLQLFAQQKIEEEGYDFVIMGHNHNPVTKNFGSGTYINLGDWLSQDRTFFQLDEDGGQLHRFAE